MPLDPLTGRQTFNQGVIFECVGVPGLIDQVMLGAPRGCRIVVVGVCMEHDSIRPMLGINKELNLQFVLGYSPEEFAKTLHNIAEGVVDLEPGTQTATAVPETILELPAPGQQPSPIVQ